MVESSNANIPVNDDDYIGDNGLWYCGKCNTPKQTRVTVLGKEFTPMCICQCEAERIRKEEEAEKERKKAELREQRRKAAFDGAGSADWTFDNSDGTSEAVKIARNYVDRWDEMKAAGKGILFFGNTGTGKSFAAACIANALIDKGLRVRMTSPSTILTDSKKWDYDEDWSEDDLLILDDMLAERESTYAQEIIQQVVDARYVSRKPMIVTTNATAEELKYPADIRKARTYSRLYEMCMPIEITGADRRRDKLKTDFTKFTNLLKGE